MAAKKKPIDGKEFNAIDSKITILQLENPPARPPGKIVGEGAEAIPQLFQLLKDEAKVL